MRRLVALTCALLLGGSAAYAQAPFCFKSSGPCAAADSPTDGGQAVSFAQVQAGLTGFGNPNISMPNGGHLAHPVYIGAYPTGLSIAGAASQSVFSGTGAGSLSLAAGVANYVGAQFVLRDAGFAATGLANIAAVRATVTFGGVTLLDQTTAALPINVANIPFVSDIVCTVQSTGATGKMSCQGTMRFGPGVQSVTPFETFIIGAPVTADLTQALAFDARATLTSTIGSPSLTIYSASIWQLN